MWQSQLHYFLSFHILQYVYVNSRRWGRGRGVFTLKMCMACQKPHHFRKSNNRPITKDLVLDFDRTSCFRENSENVIWDLRRTSFFVSISIRTLNQITVLEVWDKIFKFYLKIFKFKFFMCYLFRCPEWHWQKLM